MKTVRRFSIYQSKPLFCHLIYARTHARARAHTHTQIDAMRCSVYAWFILLNCSPLPPVILYGKLECKQTVMCITSSSLAIFQFLNILPTYVFIALIHLLAVRSLTSWVCYAHSVPFGPCLTFTYIRYSLNLLYMWSAFQFTCFVTLLKPSSKYMYHLL
jgi:hypothetical protein